MTKKQASYPLFIPPKELATKPRKHWNASEAISYKQWLLECADQRIMQLCNFSGLTIAGESNEVFETFGQFAARNLEGGRLQSEGGIESSLTNEDYAICADLGLLFAKKLLEVRSDKLRWGIVKKPKSAFSYNLPVIQGFKDGTYVDPIGGSVSEGRSILKGRGTFTVWREMFDFWQAKE